MKPHSALSAWSALLGSAVAAQTYLGQATGLLNETVTIHLATLLLLILTPTKAISDLATMTVDKAQEKVAEGGK